MLQPAKGESHTLTISAFVYKYPKLSPIAYHHTSHLELLHHFGYLLVHIPRKYFQNLIENLEQQHRRGPLLH